MNYSFLARNENHWIHFSYQYCLKHRKLNYPRDGQFLCIMDPLDPQYGTYGIPCFDPVALLLWMEEILHHLGWLKPYKQWDKPSINWCRISSIHRSTHVLKIWLQPWLFKEDMTIVFCFFPFRFSKMGFGLATPCRLLRSNLDSSLPNDFKRVLSVFMIYMELGQKPLAILVRFLRFWHIAIIVSMTFL